jgi:hypothetical protein
VLIAYNVVWWVPVVLPLVVVLSYRAGTIGFLAVTVVRAAITICIAITSCRSMQPTASHFDNLDR